MAKKKAEPEPLLRIYGSELIQVLREAGYNIPDNVNLVVNGGISFGENSGYISDEEPLEIWKRDN